MSRRDDDERYNREAIIEIGTQLQDVFTTAVLLAHGSIRDGSGLTGAPGQPRDEGTLYNSYLFEFDGPDRATIGSNVDYALAVEDGVGPHGAVQYGAENPTSPAQQGGSHSVALTVAGFDRLLDEAKRQVRSQGRAS